jgi:hypothetical protein
VAAPAHAAFPGQNGKIAFHTTQGTFTVNPDGSGAQLISDVGGYPAWTADGRYLGLASGDAVYWVTASGGAAQAVPSSHPWEQFFDDRTPTWSPDARTVVFDGGNEIVRVSLDGTDRRGLCCGNGQANEPDWSPDGSKVVFSLDDQNNTAIFDLFVINPDGSGKVRLTNGPGIETNPDWSPDGQRIAFYSSSPSGIYTMNADGTNVTFVPGTERDSDPAWSPDGTKLVVQSFDPQSQTDPIVTMDADGGNRTTIAANAASPDWGPVAEPAPPLYTRPKGATPIQVSLVPSYKPCAAPDLEHGSPLVAGACSSPQQTSDFLTMGTLDSNGQPAKFRALMQFDVIKGDPATTADEADVKVTASLDDVRCKTTYPTCEGGPLSDYSGALQGAVSLRITDRYNGPPHPAYDAGTVASPIPLAFRIPCNATSDATVGSTCAVTTTLDSLAPRTVKEGVRSIWGLDQVLVTDGGSNGASFDESTVFAVQGIFVP